MAEVIVVDGHAVAGQLVAAVIRTAIERKPDVVLGLATGSTPLVVYRELARSLNDHRVDVSGVRGFALDEYVGLPLTHPESYHSVIVRDVVGPLGLTPGNVNVPDGRLVALETAGERYEQAIRASGGIDVQILGIGRNGHLGFNEPGSSFASLTRVKALARQTREDNARFFPSIEEVPTHSITQGLGTILRARHLTLIALGAAKAEALAAAVEGPVTARVPASIIQLHPHVTVVADEAAGANLVDRAYYESAWRERPDWQSI